MNEEKWMMLIYLSISFCSCTGLLHGNYWFFILNSCVSIDPTLFCSQRWNWVSQNYRQCFILSPFFPCRKKRPPDSVGPKMTKRWFFCLFVGDMSMLLWYWKLICWFCFLGYTYMCISCQISRRNHDFFKWQFFSSHFLLPYFQYFLAIFA